MFSFCDNASSVELQEFWKLNMLKRCLKLLVLIIQRYPLSKISGPSPMKVWVVSQFNSVDHSKRPAKHRKKLWAHIIYLLRTRIELYAIESQGRSRRKGWCTFQLNHNNHVLSNSLISSSLNASNNVMLFDQMIKILMNTIYDRKNNT